MNKNISFFLVLAIFNFTCAQEETVATETQNIVTRSHNLTISIQPNNTNDTALFDQKAQELFNMIQSAHRNQNGSAFYNNLLSFIKETQEAIAAGLNLFVTASNPNSVQIKETEEAAATPVVTPEETIKPTTALDNTTSETVTNVEAAQTNIISVTEKPKKNIEISLTISLEKPEDEELFNILIVKMNDVTQAINDHSHSAEDITTMLNDLILASHHLPNTNLTIKVN